MIKQISIKTQFGYISAYETKGKIFKIKFGKIKKQIKSKLLEKFKENLLNFFSKKISNIDVPYTLEGNATQRKIWAQLKKIQMGNTMSYGQLAKKNNLSPRHIGKICGQNKLLLLVPCHRVIRTDGSLGGFSSIGGIKLKKKLIDFERM